MTQHNKRGLGKGLDALFGDKRAPIKTASHTNIGSVDTVRLKSSKMVAITALTPSSAQPRRLFNEDELTQLTSSIKEHGVLQPLLVRSILGKAGTYEIIAGERRWRAAQQAKLHELPVIVREFTDREAVEIALVENLQRSDLTAIEEAEGYQRLMDDYAHTQEVLAKIMGKSRPYIANMLRLLALPKPVREMLQGGKITAGHARALLKAENPELLAKEIGAKNLSVRDVESRLRAEKAPKTNKTPKTLKTTIRDTNIIALERDLTNRLGLKTAIQHQKNGQGMLSISYQNLDQLDDVLAKLTFE